MRVTISKLASGSYQLKTEQLVPQDRDTVFEFFADAFQLEQITPPWLHFSVLTLPPIKMAEGVLIDYKLRLHGLPIRWTSKISRWDPPYSFVDEQVKGPYRRWYHRHTFHETEQGTLVRDVVDYRVPLGFLMHPLLVSRELKRIFTFRGQALSRIFAEMVAGGQAGAMRGVDRSGLVAASRSPSSE